MALPLRQLAHHEYPTGLLHIPQPPMYLWARGTLAPEGNKHLAVVGSRAMTDYGKRMCWDLVTALKGHPITIVSGLALGMDGEAHKAALSVGLHTIAVPGSGLGDSVIYPRTHAPLARDILEAGGGLLSEHPEDHRAEIKDFPARNRIMVGMADAVLVIEAGERSGTLITARLASEYDRELLFVPHRATDPTGAGATQFIRLGATLASTPEHILEALRLS